MQTTLASFCDPNLLRKRSVEQMDQGTYVWVLLSLGRYPGAERLLLFPIDVNVGLFSPVLGRFLLLLF